MQKQCSQVWTKHHYKMLQTIDITISNTIVNLRMCGGLNSGILSSALSQKKNSLLYLFILKRQLRSSISFCIHLTHLRFTYNIIIIMTTSSSSPPSPPLSTLTEYPLFLHRIKHLHSMERLLTIKASHGKQSILVNNNC